MGDAFIVTPISNIIASKREFQNHNFASIWPDNTEELYLFFFPSPNVRFLVFCADHAAQLRRSNFCSPPFVSGLCGETQFKGQGSKTLWPKDLLKRHIPSVLWSILRRICMNNQKDFPLPVSQTGHCPTMSPYQDTESSKHSKLTSCLHNTIYNWNNLGIERDKITVCVVHKPS